MGEVAVSIKPTTARPVDDELDETNWREYAHCQGRRELFFPAHHKDIGYVKVARPLCRQCPVRVPYCEDYTLSFPASDLHGMWAGWTGRQVAAEQKKRGIKPTQPTLAQFFQQLTGRAS